MRHSQHRTASENPYMPAEATSLSTHNQYRVFLSHGGGDSFIVKHITPELEATGASVFVDKGEIKYGDNFRKRIFDELAVCDELLIIVTPTSVHRPWIFAELGVAISRQVRIVMVIYGVPEAELHSKGILSLVGHHHYVELSYIESYYEELRVRIEGNGNG